jgi:ankyrin repeat protein
MHIHVEAAAGDMRSLELLAETREDLMSIDHMGCNALHSAAQNKDAGAVRFVLSKAASSGIHDSTDFDGQNGLHHCLRKGPLSVSGDVDCISIQAGARAEHSNHAGLDPFACYITNRFFMRVSSADRTNASKIDRQLHVADFLP